MQPSLLGACVLETDRPDTAGYDQVPTCLASGENTWKTLLPRACRCRSCSVSSYDAGVHPASSAEDGSQKPPCDPNLTRPKRLGDHRCRSVRRASGLVQTPLRAPNPPQTPGHPISAPRHSGKSKPLMTVRRFKNAAPPPSSPSDS